MSKHAAQLEVVEKFGNDSLSTKTGREWTVNGTHEGAEFSFTIGPGEFRPVSEDSHAFHAVFPYRGSLRFAGISVEREGSVPNPYRPHLPHIYARDIDILSPGEPQPDLACALALGCFTTLLLKAQPATEL